MNRVLQQRDYADTVCRQFVKDMTETGFDLFHYQGRFFWEGPAVLVKTTEELKQALDASSLPAQWDRYQEGYVVFAARSDEGRSS